MYKYCLNCLASIAHNFAFANLRQTANSENNHSGFSIIDMHFHSNRWWIPEVAKLTWLRSQKDRKAHTAEDFRYLNKYNVVKSVIDRNHNQEYLKMATAKIISAHGSVATPVDSKRMWFDSDKYLAITEFEPQSSG